MLNFIKYNYIECQECEMISESRQMQFFPLEISKIIQRSSLHNLTCFGLKILHTTSAYVLSLWLKGSSCFPVELVVAKF